MPQCVRQQLQALQGAAAAARRRRRCSCCALQVAGSWSIDAAMQHVQLLRDTLPLSQRHAH
jgi:hypothetical protein